MGFNPSTLPSGGGAPNHSRYVTTPGIPLIGNSSPQTMAPPTSPYVPPHTYNPLPPVHMATSPIMPPPPPTSNSPMLSPTNNMLRTPVYWTEDEEVKIRR